MTFPPRPVILLGSLMLAAGLLPVVAAPVSALPLAPQAPAASRSQDPAPSPVIPADVWRAYRAAIVDSTTASPAEVATDLLVPTPTDPRTEWKTIDGEDYVLVGQLRSQPFTGVGVGDEFALPSDRWVSVPKQLSQACTQYRCRRLGDAALDMQLKMIMGLPPDADYGYLMHFWVKPADLFRPCTDPRPTSTSCPEQVVTDAAGAPLVPVVGSTGTSAFLWKQANYAWRLPDFFRPKVAVSCANNWTTEDCYGFPWTRLGYTYDWTPGAADDVGVTEFVAVKGATAYMESIGVQRDYFPRFAR